MPTVSVCSDNLLVPRRPLPLLETSKGIPTALMTQFAAQYHLRGLGTPKEAVQKYEKARPAFSGIDRRS
jgi:hypothetical protein